MSTLERSATANKFLELCTLQRLETIVKILETTDKITPLGFCPTKGEWIDRVTRVFRQFLCLKFDILADSWSTYIERFSQNHRVTLMGILKKLFCT
jgi:hypothetical protein